MEAVTASPQEWTQLVSKALGRPVTTEVAMRMQVEVCEKYGVTETEAETALHVCLGEVDLGAPLCSEVMLHLYRQAGVVRDHLREEELGPTWRPSQFDGRTMGEEVDRYTNQVGTARSVNSLPIERTATGCIGTPKRAACVISHS